MGHPTKPESSGGEVWAPRLETSEPHYKPPGQIPTLRPRSKAPSQREPKPQREVTPPAGARSTRDPALRGRGEGGEGRGYACSRKSPGIGRRAAPGG